MDFEPGLVFASRVRAERVGDFERWVADLLQPIEKEAGVPPYRWYRQWGSGTDGEPVEYVILGEGTDPARFDLELLLERALGAERARQELETFAGMLADDQDAWTLARVAGDAAA